MLQATLPPPLALAPCRSPGRFSQSLQPHTWKGIVYSNVFIPQTTGQIWERFECSPVYLRKGLCAEDFAKYMWKRKASWGNGDSFESFCRISLQFLRKAITSPCPIGMESTPLNLGKGKYQYHSGGASQDVTYLDGRVFWLHLWIVLC